jgi:flagellar protein FlaG
MSPPFSIDPLGTPGVPVTRAPGAAPPAGRAPATTPAATFAGALQDAQTGDRADVIPAAPPPELAAQILEAQRVGRELHERGRELHFALDGGRVRIQVRDLDGNVLKEVPPARALEIAGGADPSAELA